MYTNTSAALNTVVQCNMRLLQMENEWKLTRSELFPDGIQNTIVNLRTALVIQEAEALQDVANFMLSIQVAEDAVEKGESKEKREKSGGKVKKLPKFNWVEDIDMSIGLVNIHCSRKQ